MNDPVRVLTPSRTFTQKGDQRVRMVPVKIPLKSYAAGTK